MKYKDIEVVESTLEPRPSHTVVYVKPIKKKKNAAQNTGQDWGQETVNAPGAFTKLFWQAVCCFTLFVALLSLKLAGGGVGKAVSGFVADMVGYNIEVLGNRDEETGVFKLFEQKQKLPITLREAVPEGEFMVFNDRVLYLTDHETFVFASMGGTVTKVGRDQNGDVTLRISDGNYILEYEKLEFCSLNEGDVVEPGTMVGSFSKSGLQLRLYYKNKPMEKLSSKIIWEA